jgi:hypothetical protein
VSEQMVGHKLGEFASTRTYRGLALTKARNGCLHEVTAETTRCRHIGTKIELVADEVRGKSIERALDI